MYTTLASNNNEIGSRCGPTCLEGEFFYIFILLYFTNNDLHFEVTSICWPPLCRTATSPTSTPPIVLHLSIQRHGLKMQRGDMSRLRCAGYHFNLLASVATLPPSTLITPSTTSEAPSWRLETHHPLFCMFLSFSFFLLSVLSHSSVQLLRANNLRMVAHCLTITSRKSLPFLLSFAFKFLEVCRYLLRPLGQNYHPGSRVLRHNRQREDQDPKQRRYPP